MINFERAMSGIVGIFGPRFRQIKRVRAHRRVREFRILIAICVVALCALELWGRVSPWFVFAVVFVYLSYFVLRHYLSNMLGDAYYSSEWQLLRTQLGVLGTFALLALLFSTSEFFRQDSPLWLFFLFSIMIAAEHCSSQWLAVCLLEVTLLQMVLWYPVSTTVPISTVFARSFWISAFALIVHYSASNVEEQSRISPIANSKDVEEFVFSALSKPPRESLDREQIWAKARDLFAGISGASDVFVWIPQYSSRQLELRYAGHYRDDLGRVSGFARGLAIFLASVFLGDNWDRAKSFYGTRTVPLQKAPTETDDTEWKRITNPGKPIRHSIAIPITDFEGRPIAVVDVGFAEKLSDQEWPVIRETLLRSVHLLRPALQYADLFWRLREALDKNSSTISVATEDQLYKKIAEDTNEIFGCPVLLTIPNGHSPGKHQILEFVGFGSAALSGQSIDLPKDVLSESHPVPMSSLPRIADNDALQEYNIASCLIRPLMVDSQILSAVWILGNSSIRFYQDDILVLDMLARQWTNQIKMMMLGRAEERGRVMDDLHDSVDQQLFAMQGLAGSILQAIEQGEYGFAKDEVTQLRKVISLASKEIDSSLQEPHLLASLSQLISSFEDLRDNIKIQNPKLDIEIQFDDKLRGAAISISPVILRTLYRVGREAIHNAVKHSGARSLIVRIIQTKQTITLFVKDDGHGFDWKQVMQSGNEPSSFGLHTMKRRVEVIKGRFDISSGEQVGTEVCAEIPLANSETVRSQ